MIKINIISVGKIKESYFLDGIKEYIKRLSKYASVCETVLADEAIKDNMNPIDIKNIEGKRIIGAIDDKSYVIALDLSGKMLSSEEFASKIEEISAYHSSSITFIIGGSLGLSSEVLTKAHFKLCFGRMTYPHKLMKMILCEQIYRAFKIINNETYHK